MNFWRLFLISNLGFNSTDEIFQTYSEKAQEYVTSKNFLPRSVLGSSDCSPSPKKPIRLYDYYNFPHKQPSRFQNPCISKTESPKISLFKTVVEKKEQVVVKPLFLPVLPFEYDKDFFHEKYNKTGWLCSGCNNFNFESIFLKSQKKVQ